MTDDCEDASEDKGLNLRAGDVPHVERDALALARDTEMSHAPMAHADAEFDNQASAREPVRACQGALG